MNHFLNFIQGKRFYRHSQEHLGFKNTGKKKPYITPTHSATHTHTHTINLLTCIDSEQGSEMDSWLNIVCFRQGGMGYKLETDVQSQPKSIIKTFISKQDEAPALDV